MAELIGPANCAECGTPLEEIVRAGDAGPLVLTVHGHLIEVPGLYVCTPCAGAVMVGEKDSTVGLHDAAEYLVDKFLPMLELFMECHLDDADPAELLLAYHRAHEAAHVAELLALGGLMEAMDEAGSDEGCMVIVVVEDEPSHPRDYAELN